MIQSKKLKYTVNSQTISSSPVRFSTDILFLLLFFFVCLFCFLNQKYIFYSDTHLTMWVGE